VTVPTDVNSTLSRLQQHITTYKFAQTNSSTYDSTTHQCREELPGWRINTKVSGIDCIDINKLWHVTDIQEHIGQVGEPTRVGSQHLYKQILILKAMR